MGGQVFVCISIWSQRVELQYGSQQAAILIIGGDTPYVVFFYLVGGSHFQPWLDFIFRVDSSSQALISIGISFHDTIIVQIGQGEIIVPSVAAVSKCNVMLLHAAVFKSHIGPGRIGHTVPVLQQIIFREGIRLYHVVYVLFNTQHLGHTCQ